MTHIKMGRFQSLAMKRPCGFDYSEANGSGSGHLSLSRSLRHTQTSIKQTDKAQTSLVHAPGVAALRFADLEQGTGHGGVPGSGPRQGIGGLVVLIEVGGAVHVVQAALVDDDLAVLYPGIPVGGQAQGALVAEYAAALGLEGIGGRLDLLSRPPADKNGVGFNGV